MAAILGSIVSNLVKMAILGAVAAAGVICGHKFRDKKDAEKAAAAAKAAADAKTEADAKAATEGKSE